MPTLTIGKKTIPYTVRRSQRARRQRIIVTPKGVEVVAPASRNQDDIEAFIHSRRRWVHDEQEKIRESLATSPWPEHFVSGAKIPYRGRRMRLIVAKSSASAVTIEYRSGFQVNLPRSVTATKQDSTIRSALENWLRSRIEEDAMAFTRRHALKLGQEPRALRIKDQKHLWGSCGKDRIINLNWRLIFMPKPILEYTVVHELCHLKYRNHSPAFWSLVRELLPNFEQRKAWLEWHGSGFDL